MKTPESMTDYLKLTDAQKMELTGLPSVPSNALLALPEDVRSFIERVTLHLQSNRSKTPEQHDAMFRAAYRLYAKYDVEGRTSNSELTGNQKPGKESSNVQ
jgi:hypothetical protein